MAKKAALGKGLGALIDIREEIVEEQKKPADEISINLIDINKEQPRKHFDEDKLRELSESIAQHGIIQPLVLKPTDNGRYIIIAGERRYRAARMAGLKQVPAVIKEVNDQQLLQLALIENIQREDLNAVEEAEAIRELVERYSLNQEEAAAILGRSRSAVANSLRLLALSETMQKYIIDGKLSAGHARALMGIKDKVLQEKAALHVIEQQFSVRDTEQYVKKLITPKKPAAKKINLEFEAAERELGEALETKVQLKGNVKRGRIVIEYFSKEQLYALYDFLKQEK
ncbi:MAG: ParB/RepB/Spo0J family partition protein [Clostridia bacterium]|nr:ParB/RepB/Spo0J family partition protein [Clostridia bacterium]